MKLWRGFSENGVIQGDLMRRATLADVDLIKKILLVSFKNDPHVTWLLEESKNKFKLRVLIDYVVHQTFQQGEMYLSDDNNAVALWDFERSERMSFHYIWRNLAFLIQICITSTMVLNFLTRELRSYIGMNGTNGGFACGLGKCRVAAERFCLSVAGFPAGLVDYHDAVLPDLTRAFHQFRFREVLGWADILTDSSGIRALRRE